MRRHDSGDAQPHPREREAAPGARRTDTIVAVKQSDIARALRPFTLVLVQRALEHAGLADTFRLLPDLDQESAYQGAKSYLETPGCERDGHQWVVALLLCAEHAQRWPKTWGDLHPALVDP
jgi:hypothetical protein